MDTNTITLHGRLVKDAELKETKSEDPKTLAKFTIATRVRSTTYEGNGKDKDKSNASFFDVEAWQAVAKRCANQLKLGQGVTVHGSLVQRRWDDKEDKIQSRIVINADAISFDAPKQVEENVEDAEKAPDESQPEVEAEGSN